MSAYLPHACCHGLCATCKVQIVEGEVKHGEASTFALMDFEREEQKCLACCAVPQSDIVIEAEIDEEPDALNLPVRDFDGTVSRIERLTPTIKAVFVTLVDPGEFRFQAGQYVNLAIPGQDELTRPFSLANPPREGQIELNIRLVPGGAATGYVHDQLAVGERVTIRGPYGRFFVRKSRQTPLLFLAGGSGLSSPLSMIGDLLCEGFSAPITLVYGARSLAELYYHEQLSALAAANPNFTYVPVLSEEAWDGECGYVHEAAARYFGNDFRGQTAYLCGPPLMIDACISGLIQGRLFERDIFIERFISAADASKSARRSSKSSDAVTAYSIHIRVSGESFSCNPGKSVLGAMEALRRKGIPVGCRSGGCGVCKIRIEKGKVRRGPTSRAHVSAEEEAEGVALACRCFPEADLELSVLGKMRNSFEPRDGF